MLRHVNTQERTCALPECIDYFEICNKAEGKSPKTVSWYSANLKSFRSYLNKRHLPDSIDNIDTKLLREYVLYLLKKSRFSDHPHTPAKNKPLSTATIHGHVRTLRTFFGWLVREVLIEINSARELKPPKITKKVISTLSDEETLSILKTFNSSNRGWD